MKQCKVIRGGSSVEDGDFVEIIAGGPHQPFHATDQVARALIASTDPDEQESVVLL
jgi:uncharacterized RmlC-like cupin family protein